METMGNSLSQIILNSDTMTWFVLLSLLLMSIICWTLFFYKLVVFHIKRRHMQQVLNAVRGIQNFEQMRVVALSFSQTLPGYFLQQNIQFLKSMLESKPGARALQRHELEMLQQHVDQQLEEMIQIEEQYLPFLSVSAAASPLLGLFGTVWGLIHAFVDISQKQSADIVTVAPGIAEALITTLAGLMVAIPALIMYHYLMQKVRYFEQHYIQLADRINWVVQKFFAVGE